MQERERGVTRAGQVIPCVIIEESRYEPNNSGGSKTIPSSSLDIYLF